MSCLVCRGALLFALCVICAALHAEETGDASDPYAVSAAENGMEGHSLTQLMPAVETHWPIGGLVVDENDKPLVGATIICRGVMGFTPGHLWIETQTDEDGKWTGIVPGGKLLLILEHPDYVRLMQTVVFAGGDLAAISTVSTQLAEREYRVAMKDKRGTVIGGFVVDGVGRSVAGAQIDFYFYRGDRPSPQNIAVQPLVEINAVKPVVSNADGKWQWENAPESIRHLAIQATFEDASTRLSHVTVPSLAELDNRGDANTRLEKERRRRQLLAKTYRIGVYRPFQFQGIVVDGQGRPVRDAKVRVGLRKLVREKDFLTGRETKFQSATVGPPSRTNANGCFYFEFNSDPRQMDEYHVLIQGDGYPFCYWIACPFPEPDVQVRFVLPEGRLFEVIVIDAQSGDPIVDASVVVTPFFVQEDYRYPEETRLRVDASPFLAKTDANGIVRCHALHGIEKHTIAVTAIANGYEKKSVEMVFSTEPITERVTIRLTRID